MKNCLVASNMAVVAVALIFGEFYRSYCRQTLFNIAAQVRIQLVVGISKCRPGPNGSSAVVLRRRVTAELAVPSDAFVVDRVFFNAFTIAIQMIKS